MFATLSLEETESWIKAIESVIEKCPAPDTYSDNLKKELRNSYENKLKKKNAFQKGKDIFSSLEARYSLQKN